MSSTTDSKLSRIGILCSGSDNAGINSAIRAVVRLGSTMGIQTIGVRWGYHGLESGDFFHLGNQHMSGKIGKAGCIIGTGRTDETMEESSLPIIEKNIKKAGIQGLIIIGGNGSLNRSVRLDKIKVPYVGIPSTVQDDVAGTDISLGVDSAVNTVVKAIDNIRSCDSSRGRAFIVQVEGRTAGHLALRVALVSGAEMCLTPEMKNLTLDEVCNRAIYFSRGGKTQVVILASDGWLPVGATQSAEWDVGIGVRLLADHLRKVAEGELVVRQTVLGYVQRGGAPTSYERLIGSQFGAKALEVLASGGSGRLIAWRGNEAVDLPYEETVLKQKPAAAQDWELFEMTNS